MTIHRNPVFLTAPLQDLTQNSKLICKCANNYFSKLGESKMSSDRKRAIIAGTLFLVGFAGVVTVALTKPILDGPDYLVKLSANANQIIIGAFFQLIMAFACAGIAISLYPVLRRYNEGLAIGAVGFRIIEAVFQIIGVVGLVSLLTLSEEFVKAGAPNSSYFQIAGALLQSGNAWINNVAVLLAWSVGALMYYYVFYQTKLIPRWLSAWGLLGIVLTIATSTLVMFRIVSPFSSIQVVLNIPIALQELVLGVWLIAKGFNVSVIASD
jgi:hypothetical protein